MPRERVKEVILNDPKAAKDFLNSIGLSIEGILAIRDTAYSYLTDTSPLMASNAPGSLAYHFGLYETRAQFLSKDWEISRDGQIEAIYNPSKNIKLAYQNVDTACKKVGPQPRTKKGEGTAQQCEMNLFDYYGIPAPKYIKKPTTLKPLYYVMVDEHGAVEVTRPVIEDGAFTGYILRVFVSDGSDLHNHDITLNPDLDAPTDNFEVPVIRRKNDNV